MKNASRTKNKKRISRLHQIWRWIKNYKLLTAIVFLTLVASVFMISNKFYEDYSSQKDRENVEIMRSNLSLVQKRLVEVSKDVTWIDDSHCTVLKPRLFGERTEYYCTAAYKASQAVTNQDEVNVVLDKYQAVLGQYNDVILKINKIDRYPVFTDDITILERSDYDKLNQIYSKNFFLKDVDEKVHCSINYRLDQDEIKVTGVTLDIELRCVVDSMKAYHTPIREV